MTDVVMVYITCEDVEEARKISTTLLKKRLCGCTNIIPEIFSAYFWLPKSQAIQEDKETVLLVKSVRSKLDALEKEVEKIHSYDTPCIIALPVERVNKKYETWLKGEINHEVDK